MISFSLFPLFGRFQNEGIILSKIRYTFVHIMTDSDSSAISEGFDHKEKKIFLSGIEHTAVRALACKLNARKYEKHEENTSKEEEEEEREENTPQIPKRKPQTPILNRFYFNRSIVVKTVLNKSLQAAQSLCKAGNRVQLLVLGAGLDDYNFDSCDIYLVDLPQVIDIIDINAKPNTTYIKADIRNQDLIELLERRGLNLTFPTIILIESVLSYISTDNCLLLMGRLSKKLSQSLVLIYDIHLPSDNNRLTNCIKSFFSKNNAPLLSPSTSLSSYSTQLKDLGFANGCCLPIQEALQIFVTSTDVYSRTFEEPFDEFSSLSVLNKLYFIAIASNSEELYANIV